MFSNVLNPNLDMCVPRLMTCANFSGEEVLLVKSKLHHVTGSREEYSVSKTWLSSLDADCMTYQEHLNQFSFSQTQRNKIWF